MKRLFLFAAAAALSAGLVQAAHGQARAQTAPQATPTPVSVPGALPTTQPQSATITLPKPKSTATPAPPKEAPNTRIGISGVWEVQIQRDSGTTYTHFKLVQKGDTLTGQYLDSKGKRYPLAGTVDGKHVHVVVTMPGGTALVFSGSVEGGTDMEGTLDNAKSLIGFTAAYRPKYKWIDSLGPGAGLPGTPYR